MNILITWISENYFEIIAAIAGFIGVWLTAKQNIWCWLIGLINVVFSAIVFFSTQLYAAVVLQFFYLIITIYGWYKWHKKNDEGQKLFVTKLNKKAYLNLSIYFILCVYISGYILESYTDAQLPYFDSITTVGGIICTYLAARKILENWLIWIFIDAFATIIYLYLGLYAFAFLYFTYSLMAFYGYIQWKKTLINH